MHYFPWILVSYKSKACLGDRQLSFGKLENSKCYNFFSENRESCEVVGFFSAQTNNTLYVNEAHRPGSIIRGNEQVEVALLPKLEALQTMPPSVTHTPLSFHHCSLTWGGSLWFFCLQEPPYRNAHIHKDRPLLTLNRLLPLSSATVRGWMPSKAPLRSKRAQQWKFQGSWTKDWPMCHCISAEAARQRSYCTIPLCSPDTYALLEETRHQTLEDDTKIAA